MNRFVITVENASKAQRDAFTNFLGTQTCGWWHWVQPMWLVVDNDATRDAAWWRDRVQGFAPQATIIVLAVAPSDWAVRSHQDGHSWFNDEWMPR